MQTRKIYRITLVSLASVTFVVLLACGGAPTSVVTDSGRNPDTPGLDGETIPDQPHSAAENEVVPFKAKEAGVDPALVQAVAAGEIPILDPERLQIGDFGSIYGGGRVIGKQNSSTVQVMLDSGQTAFIININTTGVVTGSTLSLKNVLVKSTSDYNSLFGGGMTGWVLELVSDYEIERAVAKVKEMAEIERIANLEIELIELESKITAMPVQEWVDSSGKHTTRAKFIDLVDQDLQLEREDGKALNLKLDQLDELSKQRAIGKASSMGRYKGRRSQIQRELDAR